MPNPSAPPRIPVRRSDTELLQAGDYYDGQPRYFDHISEYTIIKIYTGDCYVTAEPKEVMVTILGSCIAVCMRDPVAKVGGMNHILLPGTSSTEQYGESTRFGAYAMEKIINDILKKGGHKDRLEIKIFGGARMMNISNQVGDKNIAFVKQYLKNERLRIVAEDVGGDTPRRIHYFPDTGKVKMRRLQRREDLKIVEKEQSYVKQVVVQPKEPEIELFV